MLRVFGVFIVAILVNSCGANDISGSYEADFDSIVDPKLRQSQSLFSSYKIKVTLTINQSDATIDIKGEGVNSQGKLNVTRDAGKVAILNKDNKSVLAVFVANGDNSIKCIKCLDSRTPLVWNRIKNN